MNRYETRRSRLSRRGGAALVAAALVVWACSDTPLSLPRGGEDEEESAPFPGLVVSESQASATGGAAFPSGAAALGSDVAWVSARPGSIPDAVSVRIRNLATNGPFTRDIPIRDGGFDPVAVPAAPNDALELAIRSADGAIQLVAVTVPPRRPPTVVRTSPPKGRVDVALSVQLAAVFSEPIDPASLSDGAIQLLRDGSPVQVSLRVTPETPFTAEVVPAAPLTPSTDYELVVTTAIRDLEGDALTEEVRAEFRTSDGTVAPLAMVSGDDQPARAGRQLAEPFVVRVTDGHGGPLADATVRWTVTAGEGVLDDRWQLCWVVESGAEQNSGFEFPLTTVTATSDAEGLVRMPFMPTWFGPVSVTAELPEVPGSTVTFTTDATDPGARLVVVSGSGRTMAAAPFPDGEALVVRVVDGDGEPVPYVAVAWSVASGDGVLSSPWGCPWTDEHAVHAVMRTQPGESSWIEAGRGEAVADFRPRALGPSTVTASVAGVQGSPAALTLDATALFVGLCSHPERDGEFVFCGPHLTSDVAVPVGATVLFGSGPEGARIVSTSNPPDGASFDSGALEPGDRFQFVPAVAGTWEILDEVSGAVGTLTATTDHVEVSGWGSIVVANTAAGGGFDVDGYRVRITAHPHPPRTLALDLNTEVSASGVPAGEITVELLDVAENCAVEGDARRTVSLPAGGEVRLELRTACTPPPELGNVRLVLSRWEKHAPGGEIFHLWTMNADGSDPRQLTSGTVADLGVLPSPDGSRLAFSRDVTGYGFWGKFDAFTIDPTGGAPTQLTDGTGSTLAWSWSPDGTRLALQVGSGGGRIDVIGADGSGRRVLVNDGSSSQPYWSPDGALLAFLRYIRPTKDFTCDNPTGGYEIWTMTPEGAEQRRLRKLGPCVDPSLGWSADGRIVFTDREAADQPYSVWAMDADGTDAVRLDADPDASFGAWWEDRPLVTSSRTRSGPEWGVDVYLQNVEQGRLYRITGDGVSMGAALLP